MNKTEQEAKDFFSLFMKVRNGISEKNQSNGYHLETAIKETFLEWQKQQPEATPAAPAKKLTKGCEVFMKGSSGMKGYGNIQCVSSVMGEEKISLYGHNEHYHIYDIREIASYPLIETPPPAAVDGDDGYSMEYLRRAIGAGLSIGYGGFDIEKKSEMIDSIIRSLPEAPVISTPSAAVIVEKDFDFEGWVEGEIVYRKGLAGKADDAEERKWYLGQVQMLEIVQKQIPGIYNKKGEVDGNQDQIKKVFNQLLRSSYEVIDGAFNKEVVNLKEVKKAFESLGIKEADHF